MTSGCVLTVKQVLNSKYGLMAECTFSAEPYTLGYAHSVYCWGNLYTGPAVSVAFCSYFMHSVSNDQIDICGSCNAVKNCTDAHVYRLI